MIRLPPSSTRAAPFFPSPPLSRAHRPNQMHVLAEPPWQRCELDPRGDRNDDTTGGELQARQCFAHLLRFDREYHQLGIAAGLSYVRYNADVECFAQPFSPFREQFGNGKPLAWVAGL